jgi:hypothetical protein
MLARPEGRDGHCAWRRSVLVEEVLVHAIDHVRLLVQDGSRGRPGDPENCAICLLGL